MSRFRLYLIWTLLIVPWVLILAAGSYTLWLHGWAMWVWVPVAICWGAALILIRRRRGVWQLLFQPKREVLARWTPRDHEAWQLVHRQAESVEQLAPDRLLVPQLYFDTAMKLSQDVARIYHPKADDPVANLTLPEILTAVELASADLAGMANRYLPGAHLLTVKHWKRVAKFPEWYQRFSIVYWPLSAIFAPGTVLARYATSKMIVSPISQVVQDNLLAWFYVSFVHRIGYYAIELNSGRLAGGADRFREMMRQMDEGFDSTGMPTLAPRDETEISTEPAGESAPAPQNNGRGNDKAKHEGRTHELVICLIGQCKAGKSSLVNALLLDHQATVDVTPETTTIRRHVLERRDTRDRLVLLDTVGYAVDGFDATATEELHTALKKSDLVLLVMNAASPARQPDKATLEELTRWYRSRRDLKPVPTLGVLTHIDLLRPLREWEPPYDWQNPVRPKEKSIADAIQYHRDILGSHVAGIVPVCADLERERIFGIEEFLIPAMTPLLGEARSCALLRALHDETSRDRARKVVNQLWEVGKHLLQVGTGMDRLNRR